MAPWDTFSLDTNQVIFHWILFFDANHGVLFWSKPLGESLKTSNFGWCFSGLNFSNWICWIWKEIFQSRIPVKIFWMSSSSWWCQVMAHCSAGRNPCTITPCHVCPLAQSLWTMTWQQKAVTKHRQSQNHIAKIREVATWIECHSCAPWCLSCVLCVLILTNYQLAHVGISILNVQMYVTPTPWISSHQKVFCAKIPHPKITVWDLKQHSRSAAAWLFSATFPIARTGLSVGCRGCGRLGGVGRMWLFRKVPRRSDPFSPWVFPLFLFGDFFFHPRFCEKKKKSINSCTKFPQEISNQSIPDSCGCWSHAFHLSLPFWSLKWSKNPVLWHEPLNPGCFKKGTLILAYEIIPIWLGGISSPFCTT